MQVTCIYNRNIQLTCSLVLSQGRIKSCLYSRLYFTLYLKVANTNSSTTAAVIHPWGTHRRHTKNIGLSRKRWQIALSLTVPWLSPPVPNSIRPSFRASLKQQYSSPYSCHLILGIQLHDQYLLKIFGTKVLEQKSVMCQTLQHLQPLAT